MTASVESSSRALIRFAPSTSPFNAAVTLKAIKSANMSSTNATIISDYYLNTKFFKS